VPDQRGPGRSRRQPPPLTAWLTQHLSAGRSSEADKVLVQALSDAIDDVLVDRNFVVTTDGDIIRITGNGDMVGRGSVILANVILKLPVPRLYRLKRLAQSVADDVRKCLAASSGNQEDPRDLAPRAEVAGKQMLIWWGSTQYGDAAVRLPPVDCGVG
jgi:hypothetical protein